MSEGSKGRSRLRSLALAAGVCALALAPRLWALDRFVTVDEVLWVQRSAQFLLACLKGAWGDTLVNLTPGVTTTWLGSLGLLLYYQAHRAELLLTLSEWLQVVSAEHVASVELLRVMRLPVAALASLAVAGCYLIARRLVAPQKALLAALLLAFSPQFVGLSRVLGHDAPVAIFMWLSLLALLVAFLRAERRVPWLLFSGAMAGLAWLSKAPAFFLAGFFGLLALYDVLRSRSIWKRLRLGAAHAVLWFAVAWGAFVLFWPAAWQAPLGAPQAVFESAFHSATKGRLDPEPRDDEHTSELGAAYYVVHAAYKLSPLMTVGLLAWVGLVLLRRRGEAQRADWHAELWLALFVLLFVLFVTMGGKRSGRYVLPIWGGLSLLAASGLYALAPRLRLGRAYQQAVGVALVAAATLAPYAPYYFSYFNPFLGGPFTAPQVIKIGWGEGMDQVGRWLNEQPHARLTWTGSEYTSALAPFYNGRIARPTDPGLDYVVLYIKQVQSGRPTPIASAYYLRQEPLKTVTLNGILYAQVYAGPAVRPAIDSAPDSGPWPAAFREGSPHLRIGEANTIDVLWQATPATEPWRSVLTLASLEALQEGVEATREAVLADAPEARVAFEEGLVISRHRLVAPAELARGDYALLLDGRPLGKVSARRYQAPELEEPLNLAFGGELTLLGYNRHPDSEKLRIELVWQATPGTLSDYTVFLHLVDDGGNRLAGWDRQPDVPTGHWTRGEVVVDAWGLPIPKEVPPGEYDLLLGMYRLPELTRLAIRDAQGEPLGDAVLLPFKLEVR